MRQRPRDEKAQQRRAELAESTLKTLAELGYARTSVRDIAKNSPYSHGVLHYYFKDKGELIVAAVHLFQERWSTRFDALIAEAATADELAHGLSSEVADSIAGADAEDFRLWLDLRIQSMYDERLRPGVQEIDEMLSDMGWRAMSRYAELRGGVLIASQDVIYGLLDGLCQRALLAHFAGSAEATAELKKILPAAMELLVVAA